MAQRDVPNSKSDSTAARGHTTSKYKINTEYYKFWISTLRNVPQPPSVIVRSWLDACGLQSAIQQGPTFG